MLLLQFAQTTRVLFSLENFIGGRKRLSEPIGSTVVALCENAEALTNSNNSEHWTVCSEARGCIITILCPSPRSSSIGLLSAVGRMIWEMNRIESNRMEWQAMKSLLGACLLLCLTLSTEKLIGPIRDSLPAKWRRFRGIKSYRQTHTTRGKGILEGNNKKLLKHL